MASGVSLARRLVAITSTGLEHMPFRQGTLQEKRNVKTFIIIPVNPIWNQSLLDLLPQNQIPSLNNLICKLKHAVMFMQYKLMLTIHQAFCEEIHNLMSSSQAFCEEIHNLISNKVLQFRTPDHSSEQGSHLKESLACSNRTIQQIS